METVDRQVQRLAHRAVWSEAEGELVAGVWHQSGETVAEFARRYGFPAHRLYYWRDRSRTRRQAPVSPPRFHPVRVVASADGGIPTVEKRAGPEAIEIRVIRIPCGIARDELLAVVDALGLRA